METLKTYEDLEREYSIIVPKGWYGFYAPQGWVKLVENLIIDLIKLGWDRTLHQCKDKFGGLRFYIEETTTALEERIDKAERESLRVCEICGVLNATQFQPHGWVYTFCANHKTKAEKYLKDHNGQSWFGKDFWND